MKKLRHTAEGSFLMIRNIKNTFYELDISNSSVHSVFFGFLLTKADSRTSLAKSLKVKERQKEFDVEKILGERTRRGKKEFLVE